MQKNENGEYPPHPEKVDNSRYHIVYKGRDMNTLVVVEILAALHYELDDYYVASDEDFDNYYEAIDFAKDLAARTNKNFYQR